MKRSVAAANLVLLAFCAVPVFGGWDSSAGGHPAFRTFSAADYGDPGANDTMLRDGRGRLFVSNDQLLQFDGRTWTKISINDAPRVTSIALGEDGRIWVCAVGELGYLEEDETGTLSYHSLNTYLPEGVVPTDARGVFRLHEHTLFLMEQKVLVWDGVHFERRDLSNTLHLNAFPFRNGIGVWQPGGAFWIWDGTNFQKLSSDIPERLLVAGAVRGTDDSELFVTNSVFYRDVNGASVPIPTKDGEVAYPKYLTHVSELPDGTVCISSVTEGLKLARQDGSMIRKIDRRDGLSSIECNSLLLDHENGLWIATKRNVLRVDARNSETLFDALNGLEFGAATVVSPYKDSVVVIGDEGAYSPGKSDEGRAVFALYPYSQALITDAVEIHDGRLLFAAGKWLWRPNQVGMAHLDSLGDFSRFLEPDRNSHVLFANESRIISKFDTTGKVTRVNPPLAILPDRAYDLALDRCGDLWASTEAFELFAIPYPNEPTSSQPRNWRRGKELPQDFTKSRFFVLAGEAYAYTPQAAFRLTDRGDKVPSAVLPRLGLLTVERKGDTDLWAVCAPGESQPRLVRIRSDGKELTATAMECRSLPTIGQPLTITRDNVGLAVWIGGTKGLLRVELADLAEEKKPPAPQLMRVVWRSPKGTEALALSRSFNVPFTKDGTLDIDVRDARYVLDGPGWVETRLVGSDERWTKAGLLVSYAGLQEGDYRFEARALDLEGRPGPVLSYGFAINPPWFRSRWTYTACGLCVVLAALGTIRFRTRRVAKLNVQLENLVSSRTEELTRAVAARSAFLANMGHEIRNPLNGVVGLVDSLRADHLDSAQKQTVDRLGSCAAQLVSVVEDVMEYARVDAGRVTLRQRAFSLREPVEAAIDVLRAAAPQAEIKLEAAPTDLDMRVVGDADRIRQILVNYLANALKFSAGSPIVVSLRREAGTTYFAVTDRGPGIPEDEQARLFVRFSRGSLAHQKAIPGTGLGLAACKAYAEAMGGAVGVESEPGAGSTFFLHLPLPPATESNFVPTFISPEIMVGRSALVVDDHEFNRIVLTDLLGRMGASAVSAPDIPTARDAFLARVPDVVFVDFDLAGVTGADFAQWVRNESPVGRDVPIVATSAFEVDEVRQRCEEVGMDGFVVKPVTPQKIVTVMGRIETIRTGGAVATLQTAPTLEGGVDPLDLLSDWNPKRRQELERESRRDVMMETVGTIRGLRRGNLVEAAQCVHRLISAAQVLRLREIVQTARELQRAARADDAETANTAGKKLQTLVAEARRHFKG